LFLLRLGTGNEIGNKMKDTTFPVAFRGGTMRHQTLVTLCIPLLFAASAPPAVSQSCTTSCVNYEPDPRDEALAEGSDLTQADVLIIPDWTLLPPLQQGTVRMQVTSWTYFQGWGYTACSDRDYHRQPTNGLGSGVLVGTNLILTAKHLFELGWPTPEPAVNCPHTRFVFGYGNFLDDQWQMTCSDNLPVCWVTIPETDVYSCYSIAYDPAQDWAVVTLDRTVQDSRQPLPILRNPPFPPNQTPVTIVGHPNRIPMKVEHVTVTDASQYKVGAHVLTGNSGSMVVNDGTGEVIGIASSWDGSTMIQIKQDCTVDNCHREWFGNPCAGIWLVPAWLASAAIP
jgi:V8-like Glu-specific endopeptidase